MRAQSTAMVERGACPPARRASRSLPRRTQTGRPATNRYGSERSRERRAETLRPPAAFTLVEMLVVIAIVAILSALVTPALQGLMGTSGRRGGLNTLVAIVDQARLAAIENGTTVYIGFPTNAANRTNAFSHLIVYRDPRPGDADPNPVVLSRWQRLPSGVFFAAGNGFSAALTNRSLSGASWLPPLPNSAALRNIPSLAFTRFGQLRGVSGNEVSILLGEKVDATDTTWRGGTNSHYEVRIQPLTGRAIVRDMSTNTAAR